MVQMRWMGTYDLTKAYQPGDVVYYADNGFAYVCVKNSKRIPPYLEKSGFELLSGFEIDIVDGGRF